MAKETKTKTAPKKVGAPVKKLVRHKPAPKTQSVTETLEKMAKEVSNVFK